MALKAKHPHIRIDEKIWDDPVMIALPGDAVKAYLFAIAWSKSQHGRTPDGLLTPHGIGRIGASAGDVECLVNNKLFEKCNDGYKILKYEEWQVTAREEAEETARIEWLVEHDRQKSQQQAEYGRQGAAKRWSRPPPPPPEDGFNVDAAFEEAWEAWPEAVDQKFRDKREEALEAFRTNITTAKDFADFSVALMARIRSYENESKPKAERRKFLGMFKNFCDGRWKDWIPKSHRMYKTEQKQVAPAVSESPPVVDSPYQTADQRLDAAVAEFLATNK